MSTVSAPALSWVLDHLDDVTRNAAGDYSARCPAHDDHTPSLHITPKPDAPGGYLMHCFKGCAYGDILAALEGPKIPRVNIRTNGNKAPTRRDALAWWVAYTDVPQETWEALGTRFTGTHVCFTWQDLGVEKRREAGTKGFTWAPEGGARPPLWPWVDDTLQERIYITEGESDCGVMRHLGFPTYAQTKGANGTKSLVPVWKALKSRGVTEVVFVPDADEAGAGNLEVNARQARTAGLLTFAIDLKPHLDPLLGEKDLRNVWKRVRDTGTMQELLREATMQLSGAKTGRVAVAEFLAQDIADTQWIVQDVLLPQTVSMIVGAPKLGKTWLALDLCISVATGTPFLGMFEVPKKGPVVYIMKEDPDYLLHDRIGKVMRAKNLAGKIELPRVEFPNADVPFFLDLNRDFVFDDASMESLIDWLREIKDAYGDLAMVVFDPILRMIVTKADNEFQATEMNRAVFAPAERIRSELGASVVLVHHKGKGATGGKESYGSVAFHAFSEGTLYLLGDEPDNDGWVPVRGEYKSAPETDWSYRHNELKERYAVEVQKGSKPPVRKDTVRDMILLALKEGAQMSIKDLVSKIGSTEYTVRDVLKRLEENGEVTRDQDEVKQGPGKKREVWSVPITFTKD